MSIVEEAIARSTPDEKKSEPEQLVESDDELQTILEQIKPTIKVIGCGGAGNNTIARMFEEGIEGAELIAINTDAKHLLMTSADKKMLIGRKTTKGLGSGGWPQVGEESALENKDELSDLAEGSDMVSSHVVWGVVRALVLLQWWRVLPRRLEHSPFPWSLCPSLWRGR